MKTGLTVGALCLLLSVSGCASYYKDRVNQQLWERELRLEEDCIYRLRWELEDKQRELDEANARANSLNKQTDILRDRGSGPDTGPPPAFSPSSPGGGRNNEMPRLPPAPGLPDVEPGKPFIPGSSPQGSNSRGVDSTQPELEQRGPVLSQASYTAPDETASRPPERLNPDTPVDSIELNDGLTGEVNSTGEAGAGYLSVVIQERDSHGKRVLGPGDVSIVVVDPALEGSAARIARWNFDSDEVQQHVRRNHDGGSLQFELPWPSPPEHSDLRVFVRFTTFDGRRLEANLPIDVQAGVADAGPHDWKKTALSAAARSGVDADAFDESSAAPHTAAGDSHGSVYQPDDSDAGPALTGQPQPAAATPNPQPTTSPSREPVLDASRRPAWSPYR
jgi:hypothetical protein